MTFRRRLALTLYATVVLSACGGKSTPTAPTPTIVQVAGLWGYTARLTSASGGECVGQFFQAATGVTDTGTWQVTQTGASLTARSTDSFGGTCDYTGTAGSSSIVLNASRCDVSRAILTCLNGARRELEIITEAINANVAGSSATGTSVQTWNVYIANTRVGVGVMALNGTLSATRR
jgi:hypothetical protein